jgi:hypothetical protein
MHMNMTNKQLILQMVERWPEDIPLERALYHMGVLQAIVQGLQQADQGLLIDDDEVWAKLEAEDAADQAQMDANGSRRSARHPSAHRPSNGAKKRPKVPERNPGRSKNA